MCCARDVSACSRGTNHRLLGIAVRVHEASKGCKLLVAPERAAAAWRLQSGSSRQLLSRHAQLRLFEGTIACLAFLQILRDGLQQRRGRNKELDQQGE